MIDSIAYKNSKPIVSIIVPCYNQGHLLCDALDSVIMQTYIDWECIIVNDGSTDNTESVALAYCEKDAWFIYYYQVDQDVIAPRNDAIRKSNIKYIFHWKGMTI